MARYWIAALCLCLLGVVTPAVRAEDKPRPLKVLFITGGGYHDYAAQAPFLTEAISKRANVVFDIKFGPKDSQDVPPILSDPKLGEGYDAIVYDLCYAADKDKFDLATYSKVLEITKAGKPAVVIHCGLHTLRNVPTHEWSVFAGMRTHYHEKYGPFSVHPADALDPITKGWPVDWKTAGDEQYVNDEVYPTTKPLLIAVSPNEKDKDGKPKNNVVAWQHMYGQGRVFGTTLGHDMKTIADPHYLAMVTNGLLWSCGKLQDNGQPVLGYDGPAAK